MKIIFKILIIFLISTLYLILNTTTVLAVCPVCTVAVCAGIGLSRYLKVDDMISGVWVGGLIISTIAWTLNWLNSKNLRFKFKKIIVTIITFAMVVIPLYTTKIIGHPLNKFKYLGIDKLLLGIISGSIIFVLAILFNDYLKKKNNGKVYFPFQKVIIPLLFLGINSLIFYFLSKCK